MARRLVCKTFTGILYNSLISFSASQCWDKHILVDSIIPVCKNSVLLKKGTHSFPFEILLSNALSESIECGLGNVRYKLLCQVHVKPRFIFINKSVLQAQRPVVLMRLPTLDSQQQCITQTHVINDHGGQLTLVIEKSHLIPGTFIPISFHFSPSCNIHAVEQIDVKLIERQKYRAPSKQTNRILHHEIALSSSSSSSAAILSDNELRCVYVVPDKHTIQVRASTSHPNIRVRHWIQVYLRLELKDRTIKDLQMDAPISVLLASVDDYLNLPVYTSKSGNSNNALSTAASTTPSTSSSSSVWLQKLHPIKQNNSPSIDIYSNHNHNLMKLITAPPPLYKDIAF